MPRPAIHNASTFMILCAIEAEPDGIHFHALWDRPEFRFKFRVIRNLTSRISALLDKRHKLIYTADWAQHKSESNGQNYRVSILKLTPKGQAWVKAHKAMPDGTIVDIDPKEDPDIFGAPQVLDFEESRFEPRRCSELFSALNKLPVTKPLSRRK